MRALRMFRDELLASRRLAPAGTALGLGLYAPDGQPGDLLLRTKRDTNRFLKRSLDKIKEFRFDMELVPGRLNPTR